MPHRGTRLNARRQYLLDAVQAISKHLHADEAPFAVTVVTENDAGMMITYTVSTVTQANVARSAVVDPGKLMTSVEGAFISLKHGESG